MNRRTFSFKTAIIAPFVVLFILVITVVTLMWTSNYKFLAKEQGTKILHALNETTQERLNFLLIQPLNANVVISNELSSKDLSADNMSQVESYLYRIISSLREPMPQFSVIGYGDENGNYIGFRVNPDNYSLMLKDVRTEGQLNIYEGSTIDSPVIASYDNYDPRQRPWYTPIKESPKVQWSDIYVNYDEQMESTITFLAPVFNDNNQFHGVMAGDIKLNGINNFLRNDTTTGNGVIYIIDDELNIIAHSGNENVMTVIPGDPPTGKLMQAINSENTLIEESAKLLMTSDILYENVAQQTIHGEPHFMLVSQMRSPENLNWRIVVIIPESDLMGAVQQRNTNTLLILIAITILGLSIGLVILSKITSPITESTGVATEIAAGNWKATIPTTESKIAEIHDLSTAINSLGASIENSVHQLQFNEERYRSLIENVDIMIYSLSPTGQFISINQSLENELEVGRDELIGEHYSTMFRTQENKDFWDAFINRVLDEQRRQNTQFEYKTARGQRIIISATLIPVFDETRQLRMLIGANTNITQLIEAQEEIAALNATEKERLEELVKIQTDELHLAMDELINKEKLASLGSLVSGISHEINTPLGVAVSASSLLETNSQKAAQALLEGNITKDQLITYMNSVDETGAILSNNLKRASDLVKSFKEIAVNQSSETKMQFNVYDYIQSVLLSLKHEYKNKGHSFRIVCPETLEIYSYSGAFSQILTNLIMNSLIHGFKDRNDGTIIIELIEETDKLLLIYKDNGHGIEQVNLKRIFEPFYTTNRNHGGSGLGLNIVYNLVTSKLGGTITCDSALNVGTTFTIEIMKE